MRSKRRSAAVELFRHAGFNMAYEPKRKKFFVRLPGGKYHQCLRPGKDSRWIIVMR